MAYLQIQPEFWRSSEISSQSDGCVGGNVTTAAHDLRNSIRRHLECSRQCALTHSKRFQELFQKNFSRVRTNPCHPALRFNDNRRSRPRGCHPPPCRAEPPTRNVKFLASRRELAYSKKSLRANRNDLSTPSHPDWPLHRRQRSTIGLDRRAVCDRVA